MISFNFTLQDILSSFLGFLLFPIVLLIPGYVLSWLLELFDFRKRLPFPRFGIALLISIGISPIIVYLVYLYFSTIVVWAILISFSLAFIAILIWEYQRRQLSEQKWGGSRVKRYQWLLMGIGGLWVLVSILSLVDLQLGNKLYFSVVSYDYTTRVAVTDAITRTGVPPINPSYYPGYPVPLTFLYYFWYILVSLVDQLGGPWVDARTALIASAAWCGLGLMTAVTLYIRFRIPAGGRKAWRSGILGLALLAVAGLDIIPFSVFWAALLRQNSLLIFQGDLENWNERIAAWSGALLWAPHHVAGVIACLTGLMLFHYARRQHDLRKRIVISVIIGLTFASSLGLSVWVTLVFAVFWGVWMLEILMVERQPRLVGLMALAGLVSLLAALPFIFGMFQTDPSQASPLAKFPVAISVRPFFPVKSLIENSPAYLVQLIYLAVLPISYFLELGFFFMIGLTWFLYRKTLKWRESQEKLAEALLFLTVLVITSFVISQVIHANDLAWRAWMFGQFVLIVWAVDLIPFIWGKGKSVADDASPLRKELGRSRGLLTALMIIGVISSLAALAMLRFYPVAADHSNHFKTIAGPAPNMGKRFFAARQAYEFIRDHIPENATVQYNPAIFLDLPSGLFQSRQMVISDHSIYGIPQERYAAFAKAVAVIFYRPQSQTWDPIDHICRQYLIDYIVVRDTDPLWNSLERLEQVRPPIYRNDFYQVLHCGTDALSDGRTTTLAAPTP